MRGFREMAEAMRSMMVMMVKVATTKRRSESPFPPTRVSYNLHKHIPKANLSLDFLNKYKVVPCSEARLHLLRKSRCHAELLAKQEQGVLDLV